MNVAMKRRVEMVKVQTTHNLLKTLIESFDIRRSPNHVNVFVFLELNSLKLLFLEKHFIEKPI